jgi:AMP-activated protein kinase-like protein
MKKYLCSLFITLGFLFSVTSQAVSAGAGPRECRLPIADCRLALSAEVRQTGIGQTNQDTKTTNQEVKTTAQEKNPAVSLQDYVGRYEADPSVVENFIFDVFLEKDELWIKPSHSAKSQLTAKGADSFLAAAPPVAVKFNRDAKGLVLSLTIDGPGVSNPRSINANKLALPPPSLKGNTTFRLKGYSGARIVAVAGSFNDWNQSQVLCAKEPAEWVCRIDLAPGKYTYKFIIDGDWILDPDNPNTEDDERGFTNSVLVVK